MNDEFWINTPTHRDIENIVLVRSGNQSLIFSILLCDSYNKCVLILKFIIHNLTFYVVTKIKNKMKIDNDALQKIAHLARLEMPASEEQGLLDSLNSVLNWMEELNELDTDGVQPLTHMSLEVNALREDKVIPNISREQGLKNAPKQDGEYFRVPKVME